jgi:hypothetical protein
MAKGLASSSLVPEAYRNNIPNVLIAMELASRVGASVFAVMQNLDIIHGRPGWRATFIIATINAWVASRRCASDGRASRVPTGGAAELSPRTARTVRSASAR